MKTFKPALGCLLGLAFLCFTLPTKAQNINTALAQDINNVFNPLEKNRIPHSILIDYGFDLIDVTQFDGVLRSTNYMGTERFSQIYNTLLSSITASNINGIESPTQELDEWKTLQRQSNNASKTANKASVILNGLLFNYSKFNPNALANNKIQVVNGQYDDKYINGVWQNPYDEKLAFAMVAPVLYINKPTVEASLPATLWHTNTTVTKIDIDFGDGSGYKSILNNAIAITTYTSTGTFTWTYRIQLSNGQYKYCRQKVIVKEASNTQARNPACGNLDIEEITATKAYQGVFGAATLQIAYGSADCQLRNPLIVAEGLDTGLLAQAGRIGDRDITSFFQSVDVSGSLDLQNLITNNTAIDYDVVYVNWDNGTDFIQRNAYVLEAVIDWVNANKVGNAENVVLGQSMGGLIARYALRDMENNNEDHDTSLYISHDAPHQGAHVPPGALHMARHVANEFLDAPLIGGFTIPIEGVGDVGLITIDELLDAPAVNQMLINSVNTSNARDNTMHINWQNELQNMGYPQLTRNIALSNASHCAIPQGIASNKRFLTLTGNGGTSDLGSLIEFFTFTGPLIGDYFDDTSTFLLGFLPGNSTLDIEFKVNAFPSSGTARIYKGRLTYKKTLLWVAPISRTIFNVSKYSQSSDLFLDNFPGGENPTAINVDESLVRNFYLASFGYDLNIDLNFNFISATSALDVGSGNTPLNINDYYAKYNAENPPNGNLTIPFDNFTTSFNDANNNNEPHISFNRRNGDWLATELDNNATNQQVFNCSYICRGAAISGSSQICLNETKSYTVSAWPNNANFTWSVSPAGGFTTSTNGKTITLTPNGNFQGEAIITVTADNDCGAATSTKTVQVGSKRPMIFDSNGNEQQSFTFCTTHYGELDFVTPSNAIEWEWNKLSGNFNLLAYEHSGEVYSDYPTSGIISVRARDNCGWSVPTFIVINYNNCSGGGFGNFRMAQNPISGGRLTVIERENNNSNSANRQGRGTNKNSKDSQSRQAVIEDVTFELYDYTGHMRASWTEQRDTEDWDYNFDVSQYENGNYFIRISYGNISEMYQIIIDN